MEVVMNEGASKKELLSISRIRGSLCAIFMSDIVTAECKYLREFATVRTSSSEHVSKYKFPQEALQRQATGQRGDNSGDKHG